MVEYIYTCFDPPRVLFM